MQLNQLRYFVSIAELGTVSAAAERLHKSQPVLSRQIQGLQASLGIALFENVGRNLRLTGAGEELLKFARIVLDDAEALKERAGALRSGTEGILRVGATPQTLERLFPRLLEHFRRVMPAVEVRLTENTSDALIDNLERGDIHLALATYQPRLRSSSKKILARSGLFAVSKGLLKRKSRNVNVRELEEFPLLLLHRGFGSRDLFDAACRLEHIRPKVVLESSSYGTLMALAGAGYGVAILPATIDVRARAGLSVQRVVQEGALIERYFAVHWNPERFLPPYAKLFIEELVKRAVKEYGPTRLRPR
jgi:DNA-binding transcriptional LysR family regulator